MGLLLNMIKHSFSNCVHPCFCKHDVNIGDVQQLSLRSAFQLKLSSPRVTDARVYFRETDSGVLVLDLESHLVQLLITNMALVRWHHLYHIRNLSHFTCIHPAVHSCKKHVALQTPPGCVLAEPRLSAINNERTKVKCQEREVGKCQCPLYKRDSVSYPNEQPTHNFCSNTTTTLQMRRRVKPSS